MQKNVYVGLRIEEDLYKLALKLAKKNGTTLSDIFRDGLRKAINEGLQKPVSFNDLAATIASINDSIVASFNDRFKEISERLDMIGVALKFFILSFTRTKEEKDELSSLLKKLGVP